MTRLGSLLLVLALAAVLLVACGSSEKAANDAASASVQAEHKVGCQAATAPPPKDVGRIRKPHTRLDRRKTYVATVSTNCGDFDITLDAGGRRGPAARSPTWRARASSTR